MRLFFFCCLPSVLRDASIALPLPSCLSLFAPGLTPWPGPVSHFHRFRRRCLGACLASRLPRPRQLYSDGFTLRARASIAVLTHSFTKSCAAWLAQPTPWVSNPSRYPAVTREAALSRSAARNPLFAAAARLYSQRRPPSSVSRRRSRRRPLSCFARRLYFAAAPRASYKRARSTT